MEDSKKDQDFAPPLSYTFSFYIRRQFPCCAFLLVRSLHECVFFILFTPCVLHICSMLICASPCIQTYHSSLLRSTVAYLRLFHFNIFIKSVDSLASTHTVFKSFGSQCVSSVCCMTSFVFLVVEASRNAAGKITNFSHQTVDRSAR